jgi:hypothetical protein
MRPLSIGVIAMMLLLTCGCVPLPSFFPLWDAQHDAFEPRLEGSWRDADQDDEGLLIISVLPDNNYSVTLQEKDSKTGKIKQSRYRARMLKLGSRTYLDFEMDDASLTKTFEGDVFPSLVSMHFFGRVELAGDDLKLAMLDDERFEKSASARHLDVQLPRRPDELILVSETPKIQKALIALADDKELWQEEMKFHRSAK